MKSLALISPKSSFLSQKELFTEFWNKNEYIKSYKKNWSGVSTALPLIAKLTPPDFHVEIIDENIENIDFGKKYDLVGITAMTQQAERAYEISSNFRKNGSKVIIGGIHTTLLPDEAVNHADGIVVGEAETTWKHVVEDFKIGKLKRKYVSDSNVDLSKSPIPSYDILKGKRYEVVWMQTSRGCPHDCEFCAASKIFGSKYRKKTVSQIVDEIVFAKEVFGNIWFGFGDDNLFVNRNHAHALLDEMKKLNIRWAAQSDISIAKDETLLLEMKKSGCSFVFVGLESISPEGLKGIATANWKLKQLESYPQSIKKIQSYGIGVMASFIIGLDSDDETIFDRIIEFVINNNIYEANISIVTPFPGTRLRERLDAENRILQTPWNNYTLYDVNIKHPRLSKEQLENGFLQIYQSIHTSQVYQNKLEHFKQIQKDLIKSGLF